MTEDMAVQIVRDALFWALILSSPILAAGLIIGLCVSILQAVTQIQEQTLSFVPKIIGMALVAIAITPWLASKMSEYSIKIFSGAGF